MIPHLHPDTVAEVKQQLDIVDIISDYVVLKKRGKDYQGLCPFHEEKTPSFTVNPSKQFYYCFGCQAGGNAINFLMEIGKTSYAEVVLELAKRYQVPIKTVEPEERQELQRQLSIKEQLYEIMAVATGFYEHALRQEQGDTALTYLQQQRLLQEDTIQRFQLGYAPAGWETLYRYLVEQKRYPVALVAQAGLIKQRQGKEGYYDQFRDRLMIPIHDLQGRVIAFGSRTLGDEQPKYLNSPETPLFDKGKTLFALDKARNSIIKQDQVVVVEGYFDAIALHAVNITNVVASLGTAFSEAQLKQLLRYTESNQIILNFDADNAGNKATQRAITEIEPLVYSGQVQLRVLNLPDGKDADEFLKSAPDALNSYQNALKTAPLWIDWQIQQLLAGQNLKQADQSQQVAKKMIFLLNHLENRQQRTHYISYCAELLSQGDSRLIPMYAETLKAQLKKPQITANSTQKASPKINLNLPLGQEHSLLEKAETLLLLIYIHCPQDRAKIINNLENKDIIFTLAHHRFCWQQILAIEAQQHSNLGDNEDENQLLKLLQAEMLHYPEQQQQLRHLFFLDETTKEDIERTPLLIRSAIASLERVKAEQYARSCLEKWQKIDKKQDPELEAYYFQEYYQARNRIKDLDQQRNATRIEISGFT